MSGNMSVSYDMAGEVKLSFFGIASNQIALVRTRRSAPCYNFPSRCHHSSLRSNRWIIDWRNTVQHVRTALVVCPSP